MNTTIIFLGGPMGVGKTTVGQELKDLLKDAVFIDGDEGWKGIPFVLTKENKEKVLKTNASLIEKALNSHPHYIIFTWVMDHQEIIDQIKALISMKNYHFISFSLIAKPEILIRRIETDICSGKRKDDGTINRALERLPLYQNVNSLKIDTSLKSVKEVCKDIKQVLEEQHIAYCGLDCHQCQAYLATKNNDDELRKKVAKEWSELNQIEIKPSDINCVGCRNNGVKSPFCASLCPIRQCALSKHYKTCGHCSTLNTCKKIKMIILNNQKALENLKEELQNDLPN